MNRSIWQLFLLFFAHFQLSAQLPLKPCAFDFLSSQDQLEQSEQLIQKQIRNSHLHNLPESADSLFVVPCVIHVIHNGGAENIADSQIFDQMRILNEDFRKVSGSNGFGAGVDTKIEFCLAKKDPQGRCTNGIVRVKTPLTFHQSGDRELLQELSAWDNERYLNIYVVRTINGNVGGYAAFPGGPDEIDGIVVRHDLFGSIGASQSLGRTMTHEAGHWLGLYHVFQDGCGTDTCTTGDFVCDTPPQSTPSSGCQTSRNSCSNDNPDLPDQVQNYMDYSSDFCQNMFTKGQKERMRATLNSLRKKVRTQSNLLFTGCDSSYTPPVSCPVVANFVTLTPEICSGNEVQFHNISLNDPVVFNWNFQGGSPATSTDENPLITYNTSGSYLVELIVSDGLVSDTLSYNNYINVSTPGVGRGISFAENFDGGFFPPQGIVINNPDGEISWELDSAASTSGRYSIRINNMINTNYGTTDEIILPFFDFTSATDGSEIYLSFNWAYAREKPNFSDELSVLVSTDCAANFAPVFRRSGNGLETGPTQSTPFIPDSTQWKTAKVFLKQFKDEQYLRIKFVNVTDGGNNLYLDDIYIGDGSPPVGITQSENSFSFEVFPNPGNGFYYLRSEQEGEIRVFDLYGREVPFELSKENEVMRMELNASKGTYLLLFSTEEGTISRRIVKY